ncbi:WD40 repeat-like protein [Rickenella mellea]|uniref:WD40 repeat-like protein n=1 Tax=Rickenella mellea TaxID=50990 RepID=A0A4Y7QCK0_9AGAM|nr:WD40 repeat-like protein [Rickenella mellea]
MENDLTFVAPEGVYSVTEEHKPATLNIHIVNATPAIYPTRLSKVIIRFPPPKPGTSPGLSHLLGGNLVGNKESKVKEKEKDLLKEKEKEDGKSLSSSDVADDEDNSSPDLINSPPQSASPPPLPQFEPPTLFSPPTTAISGKKKSISRPKHNIRTTSSTFVTRLQSAEGYPKNLQTRQGDVTFLFYNTAKSFLWTEAGSQAKEPLARITFSAYPTCHDVNGSTASHEKLDVVIGFSTGDLIWFDPMSSRYVRLNKQGCITNSPCTAVRWVPSSPTLFLVSHADGTIIVYDKEREDGAFTAQDPGLSNTTSHSNTEANGIVPPSPNATRQASWDPLDSMFVTMPRWHPVTAHAGNIAGGKVEKEKTTKNPVSHWRVSRRSVVDFSFSPDVKYVAAISEDGCLRVIDALAEQLVDCYASYFGSLTCVAWSPDGRLILTGGQDDLLTIFSPWEQRVVARCQGHSSFVSAVAFDDLRCDGRTYRFGSVGEDNKLILWDFSSGALHRPKLQASHHQRMSMMSSTLSLALRRRGETIDGSSLNLPPAGIDGSLSRYHPAPSRNEVAVVQPVLIKHIDGEMLTAVAFIPSALLTVTKLGHVKLWVRPLTVRSLRSLRSSHTPLDPQSLL